MHSCDFLRSTHYFTYEQSDSVWSEFLYLSHTKFDTNEKHQIRSPTQMFWLSQLSYLWSFFFLSCFLLKQTRNTQKKDRRRIQRTLICLSVVYKPSIVDFEQHHQHFFFHFVFVVVFLCVDNLLIGASLSNCLIFFFFWRKKSFVESKAYK